LHILPGQFVNLPREEKAAIMAMIDLKIESEKRAEAEIRRKTKTR